ncbi:hypothetical protein A4X09_0g6965 [Tilletia walkeri]|uniref:UBC core domain-containing protein n=1 Tax=Tilletia walkeri TaxID=117179 RepID=A0A8X7T2L0_9BASI|nr:hypothetical protein A4X09_0g6965 [Tilletia walkeri]
MSEQQQQQQPKPDRFAREGQAKFFNEDLVYHIGGLGKIGPGSREELAVVERCYYDPQESIELPALPPEQDPENLHRSLKSKEYGITCYPSGKRAIVDESTLEVRDRIFQIGDLCKRSALTTMSGVILSVTTEAQLEHVLSKQRTDWVPAEEFTNAARIFVGDHVINSNWVGVVEEVFEEALVEPHNAQDFVRVCDVGSRLIVGEIDPLGFVAAWPSLSPYVNKGPCHAIDVKQTVVCVNWLGMNQKLTPEQQEHCPRPKRYWTDLNELIMVRNYASHTHAIGNRVIPVNRDDFQKYGIRPSIHGPDKLELITMVVVSTRSKVKVLWQDNTQTTEPSTALIPYYNLDEYDVWPGDFVVWKGDSAVSEHKVGVIQSMDPEERTALVRWYDNTLPERVEKRNRGEDVTAEAKAAKERAETELVPVFELDVHGPDPVTFGVHRGDVVFISARPNGLEIPQLGRIGESEADFPDEAELRQQMSDLGMQLANRYATNCPLVLPRPGSEATEIDWYGEVVGKRMDGVVEVRIPCGRIVETTIDRLTLLSDGFEDDGGGWADDAQWSDGGSEEAGPWVTEEGDTVDEVERDEWEDMEVDGMSTDDSDDDEEGEEGDDDEEEEDDGDDDDEADTTKDLAASRSPPLSTANKRGPIRSDTNGSTATASTSAAPATTSTTAAAGGPEHERKITVDGGMPHVPSSGANMPDDDERWSRFEVLDEAPTDHAFIREPWASSSKAFFSRIQKEFKILQNALPDSILVRTYGNRTDLLRVLIIGSENTPYEDAPFVIDFCLKPTYPHEPPLAHFHSWTNGNGRVSPNLYEEGKVCLSVLNTWSGNSSENWNPSKSSLLQVFVSIQGLVLVREPWFTEPAYEKLQGTEDGKINSALYSEKAYILSRGFVRRALERPVLGLEKEIEFFYYEQGRLSRVLERAKELIEHSEAAKRRDKETNGSAQPVIQSKPEEGGTSSSLPAPPPPLSSSAMSRTTGASSDKYASAEEPAVGKLSGGGMIVLRRTLTALETLWKKRQTVNAVTAMDSVD